MIPFTSWARSSRREGGDPSSTPILKVPFNLFKGLRFPRRNRERTDPKTSGNPKKSIPNQPHRPEIRVLSLVSQVPVGPPRDPPPLPPKAVVPSSRSQRGFSSLNEVAQSSTNARNPATFSRSDSLLTAHPPSASNSTALEVGNRPSSLRAFTIHPAIGPSSLPVVASSLYQGGISTSDIAEQGGDEPPPQEDDTPRLESGASVGSFVALKSRWSSTTNYTTEEEESPSFLKSFKFRRNNKAERDRQTSGKAKKAIKTETKKTKAWVLPSFSRGPASSARIPPPPPPTGFRSSQCGSPSTSNQAESLDHPLNSGRRRTPSPKINDRHGRSQRDPPSGRQLSVQPDSKFNTSRKKVSFMQPSGNERTQVTFNRRHRAPVEALDAQGAMRQNARKSSRTDLALPSVQGAIPAKSTPLGIPSLTGDAKEDPSTKGSATRSESDGLPTARSFASPNAIALKTDEGCNGPKSVSADLAIRPNWKPTIAVWWARELPPQDDSDDTPRLATGASLKSFVSFRSRRSSSTSRDSEEAAFRRDRLVATNHGDEEQVSSTFTASACHS